MAAKTWRCAIVGAGRAGAAHARALREVPGARLVAACDHDLERARHLGATAYATLDELLDRERPDVLLVATPNGDHLRDARAAFARGVHAIVDKPLALTVAD